MILRAGLLWAANPAASGRGARYEGNPLHFSGYGLAALWDPIVTSSVTLNGNDASAIASQVPGEIDLAQVTPANQPLYLGAPTYYGQPSIQFVKANSDRLIKANTDLIGANPATFVGVQAYRTIGGAAMGNSTGNATGAALTLPGGTRDFVAWGVQDRNDGSATLGAAEVWIACDQPGVTAFLWANGTKTALSAPGTARTAPGPAAEMDIGSGGGAGQSADIDFLFGAVFSSSIPDSVAIRISHALGARFGVVA